MRTGAGMIVTVVFSLINKLPTLVIALMVMFDPNGSISGSVVDPTQWPIASAKVQLLDAIHKTVISEVATNLNGGFSFKEVAPGGYFIHIVARGFRERAASAFVQSGQSINIGNQPLMVAPAIDELMLTTADGKILPDKLDTGYLHLRHIEGKPIGTVCEFLKVNSGSIDHQYFTSVIVVGILKQTAEGIWLQQSCSNSLKSGDFVWPNAISLKEWGPHEGYWSINNSKWENDFTGHLIRPSNEDLDPRDRNGRWVAVYGVLDSCDQLVATPCGKGEICGYGYGPLSAPAQLTFQHIHIFDK